MNTPFLSVCCPTYKRPELLAEFYDCFLKQDYPMDRRELIILDDAGQFVPFHDEANNVRLISLADKIDTIGEKRNIAVSYANPESDIYVVADDDDLYFPHWLPTIGNYMSHGDVFCPSRCYEWYPWSDPISRHYGYQFNHAGHAVRMSKFREIGGYAHLPRQEDTAFFGKLRERHARQVFSPVFSRPYYVARRNNWSGKHETTNWNPDVEKQLREMPCERNLELKPKDTAEYFAKLNSIFDVSIKAEIFTIQRGWQVGFDKLRINENQPWELSEKGDYVIFAHAPSRITLKFTSPVRIYGALNQSAHSHHKPCEFRYFYSNPRTYLKSDTSGVLFEAGQKTRELIVPRPDTITLEVLSDYPEGRHALWVVNTQ